MESESGMLKTKDGNDIFYNYLETKEHTNRAVILAHQYRRDHRSYSAFQEALAREGFSSVAIDLRGHGKSSGKWMDFSEEDFRKMGQDIYAARNLLLLKKKKNIFLIGASIGANTALNFANENRDIKAIVLLSPGEEYHGISTEESAVRNRVPTFILVSKEDEYSFVSSERIFNRLPLPPEEKKFKIYPGHHHGVDMFIGTDMERSIIDWLKKMLIVKE